MEIQKGGQVDRTGGRPDKSGVGCPDLVGAFCLHSFEQVSSPAVPELSASHTSAVGAASLQAVLPHESAGAALTDGQVLGAKRAEDSAAAVAKKGDDNAFYG